jgi:hypothetical protein
VCSNSASYWRPRRNRRHDSIAVSSSSALVRACCGAVRVGLALALASVAPCQLVEPQRGSRFRRTFEKR